MDRIRTQSIDGGRLQAAQELKSAVEGRSEMPFDLGAKLYLQTGKMLRHPLVENFNQVLRFPLTDVVALLWRIKEVEQAGLGEAACDLFRDSVEQSGMSVKAQMQTARRLSQGYGIDLHGENLAGMRRVALQIVAKLRSELHSWDQTIPDLAADERLIGEFLAQELPLYWGVLIDLGLIVRQSREKLERSLNDVSFSLEMIGSPVQVNQRLAKNLLVGLWRVLSVLDDLKKDLGPKGAVPMGNARLERILDRNLICPPYHLRLAESVEKVSSLLGNQDFSEPLYDLLPNYLAMKKNYLYRLCLGNFFRCASTEAHGGVKRPLEIPGTDGSLIKYTEQRLEDFFSARLLSLANYALQNNLLEECETLVRTEVLAGNLNDTTAPGRQQEAFTEWKQMEERIGRQRRMFRLKALRIVK